MSKRPKRSAVLQHSKALVTTYYVVCPHCKTELIGIGTCIDRMRCWRCREVVILDWPEKALKGD